MGAIGLAIGQAVMGYMQDRNNYKAQLKAQQMKMQNAVKTMNHSFQNLEAQRSDAFDATVAELTKIQLQNRNLEGGVRAAISEELGEGRTASLLNRATMALGLRAQGALRSNYVRESNEIDRNKETAYNSMVNFVQGLELPSKPNIFKHAVNAFFAYKGAKNNQEIINNYRMSHGIGEQNQPIMPWGYGYNATNSWQPYFMPHSYPMYGYNRFRIGGGY